MWVVKTINRDNIEDIVSSLQNIYKLDNRDIVLTLSSSLGFAETYLYMYEIMKILLEKGVHIKRGPLIIGNVVLINEKAFKLEKIALEDIVWWLAHNNMLEESFDSIMLEDNLIIIDDFVLKRG